MCFVFLSYIFSARLQEARLEVLKDLLRQRDEAQKDVTNDRLNQIYSKHQEDRETKLNKIHADYNRCKTSTPLMLSILFNIWSHSWVTASVFLFLFLSAALRKLEAKRKNVEGKLERCVIASQTYVPRIRIGIFPNRNINSMLSTRRYLDTYEGLNLNAVADVKFLYVISSITHRDNFRNSLLRSFLTLC